jgi:O-antigen/teichoic acid export membrane protein
LIPPVGVLGRRILRQSGHVFVIRIVAMVLLFGQTLVLARNLGATEYGSYAWALAWLTIARLVVGLGFDKSVVREIALDSRTGDMARMRGLLRKCTQALVLVTVITAPVVLALGWLIADDTTAQFDALVNGVAWLPIIGATILCGAALQGLARVTEGRVPEDLVFPGLFFGALIVVFATDTSVDASLAMLLRVAAAFVAAVIAVVLLVRALPRELRAAEPVYDTKRWFAGILPLVLIGSANVMIQETGTITVGAFEGSAEAGGYAVAVRIAFLLTLTEFAANAALSPVVAQLHAGGEHSRLQKGLTRGATAVFLLSAAGAAVMLAIPEALLGIFGSEYEGSAAVLRLLAIGWLLNLAGGFCGLVLVMTHQERQAAKGIVGAAILNVPMTLVLVSELGAPGAAIGTGATMLLWNVVLVRRVWLTWRVDTTPFGLIARLRSAQ